MRMLWSPGCPQGWRRLGSREDKMQKLGQEWSHSRHVLSTGLSHRLWTLDTTDDTSHHRRDERKVLNEPWRLSSAWRGRERQGWSQRWRLVSVVPHTWKVEVKWWIKSSRPVYAIQQVQGQPDLHKYPLSSSCPGWLFHQLDTNYSHLEGGNINWGKLPLAWPVGESVVPFSRSLIDM